MKIFILEGIRVVTRSKVIKFLDLLHAAENGIVRKVSSRSIAVSRVRVAGTGQSAFIIAKG